MLKKAIAAYGILVVPFTLYGWWFGEFGYKGFAYNFGRAIIWPVMLFPSLGPIIGGMVILAVIAALALKR